MRTILPDSNDIVLMHSDIAHKVCSDICLSASCGRFNAYLFEAYLLTEYAISKTELESQGIDVCLFKAFLLTECAYSGRIL